MSRPFAVLSKILPIGSDGSSRVQSPVRLSEYAELIQKLFQERAAVAIIGAGLGTSVTVICEALASELSRLGKRVVLVSVNALLQTNPMTVSDNPAVLPTRGGDYWVWPPPVRQQMECVKPRTPGSVAARWLDSLRQDFDSIVLDCPALEIIPGGGAIGAMVDATVLAVTAIAAMADATVLAVDAARTPKQQIMLDQRLLQLSNAKLAGCVLIKGN
jgi:hypothetical protein